MDSITQAALGAVVGEARTGDCALLPGVVVGKVDG